MSILKITFTGKIQEKDQNKILDDLLINLKKAIHGKIEKTDSNTIIVVGEFSMIRLSEKQPLNFFYRFPEKALIHLKDNTTIQYTVDITIVFSNSIHFKV